MFTGVSDNGKVANECVEVSNGLLTLYESCEFLEVIFMNTSARLLDATVSLQKEIFNPLHVYY